MREAAVVTFSFKYVNRLGVPDSFIPRSGRVTRDGLILEDGRIFFRDILPILPVVHTARPCGPSLRPVLTARPYLRLHSATSSCVAGGV